MTRWARGALLGALALAACGRGGGGGGQQVLATGKPADPAAVPPPVTAPASSPGDCPDGVTIRVLGVDQRGISLSLAPGIVGVACAPAAPVCVTRDVPAEAGDLSSDATPWNLGSFNLPPEGFPPDGAPMTLLVTFAGGTATVGGTTGQLGLCGPSISFPFDPGRVNRDRCAVTILLDVGRSVVPSAGGLLFIPQYRVYF